MKYLETYENYSILEIGDAKLPPYEIDNELDIQTPIGPIGYNYFFNTESGLRYSINLMIGMNKQQIYQEDVEKCSIIDNVDEFYNSVVSVSFFPFTGDDEEVYHTYNDKIITNKGELFRIMATIKYILETYISNNSNIKYIFIGGQRSKKIKDKEQRDKLYLLYLKKLKPEWKIEKIYCGEMDEYYYIAKIK